MNENESFSYLWEVGCSSHLILPHSINNNNNHNFDPKYFCVHEAILNMTQILMGLHLHLKSCLCVGSHQRWHITDLSLQMLIRPANENKLNYKIKWVRNEKEIFDASHYNITEFAH